MESAIAACASELVDTPPLTMVYVVPSTLYLAFNELGVLDPIQMPPT